MLHKTPACGILVPGCGTVTALSSQIVLRMCPVYSREFVCDGQRHECWWLTLEVFGSARSWVLYLPYMHLCIYRFSYPAVGLRNLEDAKTFPRPCPFSQTCDASNVENPPRVRCPPPWVRCPPTGSVAPRKGLVVKLLFFVEEREGCLCFWNIFHV